MWFTGDGKGITIETDVVPMRTVPGKTVYEDSPSDGKNCEFVQRNGANILLPST